MSAGIGPVLLELAITHLLPILVKEASNHLLKPNTVGARRFAANHLAHATPSRQLPLPKNSPVAVQSHLPGRVRLRIANLRDDAALGDAFAKELRAIPGMHQVSVSTLTGSVLLRYDPHAASIGEIAAVLDSTMRHPRRQADKH